MQMKSLQIVFKEINTKQVKKVWTFKKFVKLNQITFRNLYDRVESLLKLRTENKVLIN